MGAAAGDPVSIVTQAVAMLNGQSWLWEDDPHGKTGGEIKSQSIEEEGREQGIASQGERRGWGSQVNTHSRDWAPWSEWE